MESYGADHVKILGAMVMIVGRYEELWCRSYGDMESYGADHMEI
jgi:hypothetical protein